MAYKYGTSAGEVLKGGAGEDSLYGFGGNDTLLGLAEDDRLFGGTGNDYLGGGDGDDRLYGDSGNDRLYGNAGNDWLVGGSGNDRIDGGAGDDTIVGLSGTDTIIGGDGTDTLDVSALGGTGTLGIYLNLSTTATDKIVYDYGTGATSSVASIEKVIGTARNDYVYMGAGDDWFEGGAGNDQFSGGAGSDYFWGGAGIDTASYGSAASGVSVALQSFNATGTGDAAGDVILQVENLTGSAHADTLTGDSQNNVIRGGGGRDVINALTGSDTVYGGGGADTFVFQKSFTVNHYGSVSTYTDYGDDVIKDYVDDVDLIEIVGYRRQDVSVEDRGADAILHLGYQVDVRVEGAAGALDFGDLMFA